MTKTSLEANKSIGPLKSELRKQIYDYLRFHGPATDEQIQRGLDMAANTERPRRGELVTAGLVKDSGVRQFLRSGRKGIAWERAAE